MFAFEEQGEITSTRNGPLQKEDQWNGKKDGAVPLNAWSYWGKISEKVGGIETSARTRNEK